MTPLDRITLHPRHHKTALWWAGLLYRKPDMFKAAFPITPIRTIATGTTLYLHVLPYLFIVSAVTYLLPISLFVLLISLPSGKYIYEALLDILDSIYYETLLILHSLNFISWESSYETLRTPNSLNFISGEPSYETLLTPHSLNFISGESYYEIVWTNAFLIAVGIGAVGIAVGIVVGIIAGIARGIVVGIIFTIVFAIVWQITFPIVFGIAWAITFGIVMEVDFRIVFAIASGMVFGITLAINFGIARAIDLVVTYGIFLGVALFGFAVEFPLGVYREIGIETREGIIGGIAMGIAGAISLARAYYLPYHLGFVWPRLQAKRYHLHPVAWDNFCWTPFPALDKLLADFAELEPETGRKEIDRLINDYPSQRKSALCAQCRLLARAAGRANQLFGLDQIVAALPEGDKDFLAHTAKLKIEINDIASLQRRLDVQTRPFLKEPEAALLVEKIITFQSRVSGYQEPLGSEFRQAAANWLIIAKAQLQRLRTVLNKQPQPQVFHAGDPVNREQEAFVPRLEVLGELDRQLSLATGCPGLILYGRRRMGKTTLLKNLDDFLPRSVRVGWISMQNPKASASITGWLDLVSKPLRYIWPDFERPSIPETREAFFDLLDACDRRLQDSNLRLLLAIDEYEYIDEKIGAGIFSVDLLHTIRESIQSHRHIIWLFAGSHAIEELQHAEWPSYLISARTVEVPAFSLEETRLLLTEPLRHSRLWHENDPQRPRFPADFWGEQGIEHIYAETAGWPHLVQLLAETAVDLSNEQQAASIDAALLEKAIDKAVTAGDTVLRQLLYGESSDAEWQWLKGFRFHDTQPIPNDETTYQSLRRRWLVVDAGSGEWRLRVPLLQRWLRKRG